MAMTFEVRIRASRSPCGQADLIRCVLVNAGVPPHQIVEQVQKGASIISVYESSRSRGTAVASRVRALKLRGISVSVRHIRDRDWTTQWKKYFKPFNITRNIRLVPVWKKHAAVPAGSSAVYLDTTFAFGSGLHATTQMMAQFLYRRRRHLGAFLDIGTGSGILSLIANVYGAAPVYAIDLDPVAVKTAGHNCRINHCRFRYLKTVKFEDFSAPVKFDFVAANLLTEDLIRLRQKLVTAVAPGGYLAASGIFRENYPLFRKRFIHPRLRCVAVGCKKDWYAVLFKKL